MKEDYIILDLVQCEIKSDLQKYKNFLSLATVQRDCPTELHHGYFALQPAMVRLKFQVFGLTLTHVLTCNSFSHAQWYRASLISRDSDFQFLFP